LLPFFGNTVVATVTSPGISDKIATDRDEVTDPDLHGALSQMLTAF